MGLISRVSSRTYRMSDSRLDYVIFGASGFTGEFVAQDIAKNHPNATFAIAGRTQAKLDKVNLGLSRKANRIVLANVNDQESLVKMAAQAKVLINCVGPYRFYGLAIVEAAIEASTSYCDISGEPWFLEKSEFEFNDLAKEKGVYVVSACGFDSIPSDMGVEFTRREFESKFPGEKLNSIEAYLKFVTKNGYSAHATTLECAVHGFSSIKDLMSLRKAAKAKNPETVPAAGKRLRPRKNFHAQPKDASRAALPFPGSDRSIVKRSQQRIAQNSSSNPIEFFYLLYHSEHFYEQSAVGHFWWDIQYARKIRLGKKLNHQIPKHILGWRFLPRGPDSRATRRRQLSIRLSRRR